MVRRTSTWFAIAALTLAVFTSACDRTDATGPSEAPVPSLSENQGGNN